MPTISFEGKSIEVTKGANLKKALKKANLSPYNGISSILNCHGIGSCGTCAVAVSGLTSEPTKIEKWRLNFPPHKTSNKLRLACQVKILGDVKIQKFDGFWGNIKR